MSGKTRTTTITSSLYRKIFSFTLISHPNSVNKIVTDFDTFIIHSQTK